MVSAGLDPLGSHRRDVEVPVVAGQATGAEAIPVRMTPVRDPSDPRLNMILDS